MRSMKAFYSAMALVSILLLIFSSVANSQDVASVATAAKPSIAVVLTERPDGVASGTGFVAADRLVITANHVVEGATRILLKLPDYPPVDAKLAASDRSNDIAVLSIPRLPVRPLLLGDITQVHEGQTVIVIGFPRVEVLGGETPTVTEGIVSALRRGLIQMQAPVSPGNSGGPVLNMQGEVIGVVAGTLKGEQQGINFAIPINAAKPLLGTAIIGSPPTPPSSSGTSVSMPTSPAGLPDSVDAPIWSVGDTWTYRLANGSHHILTVVTVTDDYFAVRHDWESGHEVLQWSRTQSGPNWQAPGGGANKLDWPLGIGKRWSIYNTGTSVSGQVGNAWRTDWNVEKLETVRVPAGTFQAYRITGTECNLGSNICGQLWIWYAPEVKNVLKVAWDNIVFWGPIGGNTLRGKSDELLSYHLNTP